MQVIIIEDEKPAAEKLKKALLQYDPAIEVLQMSASVREAAEWLRQHPCPDLIFMDIELTDGLSFRIFDTFTPSCPVIFITAYDEYWQEAFGYNGIDYLLKPIRQEKLVNALNKYKRLQKHFTTNYATLLREWQAIGQNNGYRQRFLVKKGIEWITIQTAEIAYCYSAYKLVFLIERTGQKHIVDKSLNDLEKELDPALFFRVNRKYLVNIHQVRKIKALLKGKLLLDLSPKSGEEILVSQERAGAFKIWMGN